MSIKICNAKFDRLRRWMLGRPELVGFEAKNYTLVGTFQHGRNQIKITVSTPGALSVEWKMRGNEMHPISENMLSLWTDDIESTKVLGEILRGVLQRITTPVVKGVNRD